jgi:hypothetical protein
MDRGWLDEWRVSVTAEVAGLLETSSHGSASNPA